MISSFMGMLKVLGGRNQVLASKPDSLLILFRGYHEDRYRKQS